MIWRVVLTHNDWYKIMFDFDSWIQAGAFAQKIIEHYSLDNNDDDKITVNIEVTKKEEE